MILLTPDELEALVERAVNSAVAKINLEKPSKQPDKLLTRKEVAEVLHISLVTLNTWTFDGKINASRIGNRVLYKQSDVNASLTGIVINKKR